MNYGEQRQAQALALADQRQHVRRYLSNTHALEAVMADIAEGTKVTDIAKRLNVSYQALYSVLTNTYKEQFRAARAAYAEVLAEKNLEVADKIQSLELPHDAGKAAVGIRQWHMERTAGEQWGQRSSVDVTHRGVVGLHLEAIRQLSEEPIEGEVVEVEDVGSRDDYDSDADCRAGDPDDELKGSENGNGGADSRGGDDSVGDAPDTGDSDTVGDGQPVLRGEDLL